MGISTYKQATDSGRSAFFVPLDIVAEGPRDGRSMKPSWGEVAPRGKGTFLIASCSIPVPRKAMIGEPVVSPKLSIGAGVRTYLEHEELWSVLRAIVESCDQLLSYQGLQARLVEFRDELGTKLVEVEIQAGLHGAEAVEQEDKIVEAVLDRIGPEKAAKFMVSVR